MSQALSTSEQVSPEGQLQGHREAISLDPRLPYGSGLHVPLTLSRGFQPLLQGVSTPPIDWEHWRVTATVTVVPGGQGLDHSTSTPSEKTDPVTAIAPDCPADAEAMALRHQAVAVGHPDAYSIQVNNRTVGALTSRAAAEAVAAQMRQAIATVEADPSQLLPLLQAGKAAAQVNGNTVFALTDDLVPAGDIATAVIATEWVNNLRQIFGAQPLGLGLVQMVAQGLGDTDQVIRGTASWYGPYFHGRQTATGEIYNQHGLTAAHKTLPFGTQLRVRNLLNDKTVVVRINDRGPYIGDRSLDLSYAAAQCLDSQIAGVIPYEATILEPGLPTAWQAD
jgi:rare lipoprotein A (peptidoglycan hydrolase)